MDDQTRRPGVTRRDWLARGSAVAVGGLLAGCTGSGAVGGFVPPRADRIPYDVSVAHDVTEWAGYDPDWETPATAPETGAYAVDTVVENLAIPWDLSVASTGELFVTERPGRLVAVDGGGLRTVAEPEDVIDAEAVSPGSDEGSWLIEGGEGGLLGVAVHPTYPDPPLVYAYLTMEREEERTNAVVAIDVHADDPSTRVWPVVADIPASTYHNGGRIAFGPANYLWVATGDADPRVERRDRTADPGSLAGKILRVHPDGSAPESNPDIASGADPSVYTYGHRNPQGISWLPDATPVITEHGPGKGDEVNVLRAGENYGWPYARNSGSFAGYAGTDYRPPIADAPDWAPSGCTFYTGSAVPSLRNRLLVGGLASQQLLAVTVARDATSLAADHDHRHDAEWLDGDYRAATGSLLSERLGRIRHVVQGPEGDVYALTSNRDGRGGDAFPTDRDDVLVRISDA